MMTEAESKPISKQMCMRAATDVDSIVMLLQEPPPPDGKAHGMAKEFSGEVHIADAADIATWFVSETKSGLWGHYADAKIVTLDETAANLANLNLEGDIEQIKRRQRVRPGTFLHWMIQHEEGKKEQERKGRGG